MTQPQIINQTIQFQKDSVVSKEILNKPNGTITLFAFDRGQGLSEHTAPHDAFVMITEGMAEILVANIKHEVKTGEMLLMPANNPHSVKALQPFKMILVMIKS